MGKFTSILLDAEKMRHPLAGSITIDETQFLIIQLRKRLEQTESELDLSPESLNKLEDRLIDYYRVSLKYLENREEILSFIRELAGYIGTVLVLHTDGKWNPLNTLWNTHIEFLNVKVEEDGKMYTAPELVYSLGNIATITLDKIDHDIKPNLYKYYRNGKNKGFREN
jgi:hypothetical protein